MLTGPAYLEKRDWQLGALYRLGRRRGFDRQTIAAVMRDRIGMAAVAAATLARHWDGPLAADRKRAAAALEA